MGYSTSNSVAVVSPLHVGTASTRATWFGFGCPLPGIARGW
jgi:hypothetical protein